MFRPIISEDFYDKKDLNNQSNIQFHPYLTISGMGAGHGVGMSQWGARYMADKGYKANQILKYFYKGVNIKPFIHRYK